MELQDRTAVITGAASGIGLALTEACLAEGMQVAMADIEEAVLARRVAELTSTGAPVIGVPTDVSRLSDLQDLAVQVERVFGPVSLLCNNAGVGPMGPPVWKLTEADWRWVLDVNLFGVIHGIQTFLPGMVERGEGHIVNTSSAAGLLSPPGMAPYVASKHAIVAISEVLQHELASAGQDIGVTVVCPGLVATNMPDNERNRQAAYRLDKATVDERNAEFEGALEGMRSATRAGRDPAELAGLVIEAVTQGRFYLVPDDWILDSLRVRAADILEQRSPTDPT